MITALPITISNKASQEKKKENEERVSEQKHTYAALQNPLDQHISNTVQYRWWPKAIVKTGTTAILTFNQGRPSYSQSKSTSHQA